MLHFLELDNSLNAASGDGSVSRFTKSDSLMLWFVSIE